MLVYCSAQPYALRMSSEQIEDILSGRSPRHPTPRRDATSPRKQRRTEQERQELLRWMEEKRSDRMKDFKKSQQERREKEVHPFKPSEDSKNMVRLCD